MKNILAILIIVLVFILLMAMVWTIHDIRKYEIFMSARRDMISHGGFIAPVNLPLKIIINSLQKIITKFIGNNNVVGLTTFGELITTTDLNGNTGCNFSNSQAKFVDSITECNIFSSIMYVLRNNNNIADMINGVYGIVMKQSKLTMAQKIMIGKKIISNLSNMSVADMTSFPKACIKMIILVSVDIFNDKKPLLIQFLKSLTDDEILCLEYAFSAGTVSVINFNLLLRDFLPFVLEKIDSKDVGYIINCILSHKKIDKEQIIQIVGNSPNYTEVLEKIPMYVIGLFEIKTLNKIA